MKEILIPIRIGEKPRKRTSRKTASNKKSKEVLADIVSHTAASFVRTTILCKVVQIRTNDVARVLVDF